MKLVVLDGHTMNPGDISWVPYEALGELKVFGSATNDEDEIIRRLEGAEIALVNDSPMTRRVIEACPELKFIAVQSTGFNAVDLKAARERGIPVSNVPDYGTMAVAQYAIAHLLEICGHVSHHSKRVHEGAWLECGDWCFWDYPMIELYGKTMGIIGFGRIGQQVGRIAAALGMKVLAFNRSRSEEGARIADYVELDELLSRSDVISLHAPLTAESRNIINRETIGKMKDGVIIINNSRGGLIVEEDLAEALESGKVYAAGLDVVRNEPITEASPLYHAKNCFITPHISWAPKECRQRIVDTSAENIRAFLAGRPQNVVN